VVSPTAGFTQAILNASTGLTALRTVRLWTDDFSNLYQILK